MKSTTARVAAELILLTVVVAILSIAAAPSYHRLYAPAKVARAYDDFAAIGSALDAYALEGAGYPPTTFGTPGPSNTYRPLYTLTTPVAYLSAVPSSPFVESFFATGEDARRYTYARKFRTGTTGTIDTAYQNPVLGFTFGSTALTTEATDFLNASNWYLRSVGPDQASNVSGYIRYDPTNGSDSRGDLVRISNRELFTKPDVPDGWEVQ